MISRSIVLSLFLFATVQIGWSQPANEPTAEANLKFALELFEQQDYSNAREKLERKNFDLIVLNSLRDAGAGFHHDTNKVTILYRNNKADHFQLKSKKAVAEDIVVAMARHWGLDEQPQAAG